MWQKAILAVCLAALALGQETDNCFDVQCGTGTTTSKCVTIDSASKNVTLTPCAENYLCSSGGFSSYIGASSFEGSCFNFGTDEAETTDDCSYYPGSQDAGESCCVDADCFSGSCSSKTCSPVGEGEACESYDQCDVNYYCSNSKCTAAKDDGESCGDDDEECKAGSACNKGSCTKLYSLDDGASSDSDKFCKSGWETEDKCLSVTSVSVGDAQLESPFKCTIGETCKFTFSDETTDEKKCSCAGSSGTEGYCYDSRYTRYMKGHMDKVYAEFSAGDGGNCYGGSSHSGSFSTLSSCGMISQELYEFESKMEQQYENWPLYQSGVIDGCALALNIFDPDYTEDDYDSAFGLLASLALLILN